VNDCTRTASFVSYRPNHLLGISEGGIDYGIVSPPKRKCAACRTVLRTSNAGTYCWQCERRMITEALKRDADFSVPRYNGKYCGQMTPEERLQFGSGPNAVRRWRRHKGLCYLCGAVPKQGMVLCGICNQRRNERQRALYQSKKAATPVSEKGTQ